MNDRTGADADVAADEYEWTDGDAFAEAGGRIDAGHGVDANRRPGNRRGKYLQRPGSGQLRVVDHEHRPRPRRGNLHRLLDDDRSGLAVRQFAHVGVGAEERKLGRRRLRQRRHAGDVDICRRRHRTTEPCGDFRKHWHGNYFFSLANFASIRVMTFSLRSNPLLA